jgi:antitoxin HigA-1
MTGKPGETMQMHDPPHVGEVLRELCLNPRKLSVTAAARWLGVSRKALSELLNGRSGLSPEMAVRIAKAFGSTPDHWLRMQMQYDLWRVGSRVDSIKVEPFPIPDELRGDPA